MEYLVKKINKKTNKILLLAINHHNFFKFIKKIFLKETKSYKKQSKKNNLSTENNNSNIQDFNNNLQVKFQYFKDIEICGKSVDCIPKCFDWRNKDGINYDTPIKK